MANRRFNQFGLSLENRIVHLFLRATIGAAGAPTLVAAKSKGIVSITRTGAGAYDIVLQDTFVDLFSAVPTIQAAGSPASGAVMTVTAQTVNTATKTISVAFQNGSFVNTDLASGVTLGLMFVMKDSTT